MTASLYSLEKLIEWKPEDSFHFRKFLENSLLAREINWMETKTNFPRFVAILFSLLAREINWMETIKDNYIKKLLKNSLLAREINWMETVLGSRLGTRSR